MTSRVSTNLSTIGTIKGYKAYKGMGMDGPIARWYARLAQRNLEQYKAWAKIAAENVPPGGAALEVAPGPGYLAVELAKMGRRMIKVGGLDISQTMVDIARDNAEEAEAKVDFRKGDAAHMPFASESFDFVICTWAFKNFTNPTSALQEMWRVLRPGRKALIIDLRRNASPEEIDQHIGAMRAGWFNSQFLRWAFNSVLVKRAYSGEEIRKLVSMTKFSRCDIRDSGIGFEITLEKG